MLLLIASLAASSAAAPAQPPVGATARAQASIRIVQGYRLIAAGDRTSEGRPFARKLIRGEGGELRPARLVEFE
jgi:hypothetical protein